LWSLFKNQKEPGFFVDIGALDGKRCSNTYSFELVGWKGVCAEAHPFYIDYLKKNRPDSIIVHAAIAAKNKESVTFYTNYLGSLSTLDKRLGGYFKKQYGKNFGGFKPVQVPMRTVDSILEENEIESVDVVSIDVEGTELAVLRGFDLRKYKPRVLVIEAIDSRRKKLLDRHMKAVGYKFARSRSNNYFYCRDEADVEIIKKATIDGPLIATDHPLVKKRERFGK
jgi:FkbM family methyltransferase